MKNTTEHDPGTAGWAAASRPPAGGKFRAAFSGLSILVIAFVGARLIFGGGVAGLGGTANKPAYFERHDRLATALPEAQETGRPVLVFATADWCGPCQALKPVLADAARTSKGLLRVYCVDVDAEPAVALGAAQESDMPNFKGS